MYNDYEYTYRTVYILDTNLHTYQIYIYIPGIYIRLNISTRYVYLCEWRHSFVVTKLHTRRTVQLPIDRASSLWQINQNVKELHELLLHVFGV